MAPGTLGGGIAGQLGVDLPSIFTEDGTGQIKSAADFLKGVYGDLRDTAGQAIGSMIQGLNQLVNQWILTGKFSAQAALQMAAGVLLGVAMQSGVKAIFEVAEGMAAAASFNPYSAALHFAAAKVYGLVALGTGIAGVGAAIGARALAKESSGAYGSASTSPGRSSGNGGQVFSSQKETVDEQSANNPGAGGILSNLKSEITLKIESTTAHIVEVVKDNIHNNGPLRTAVQDATG
jgi:hypothetical protein